MGSSTLAELLVRVQPDVPGLAKAFDYAAPEGVGVGTRVRIRLHGRAVGGWVVATGVEPPPGVVPAPVTRVSGHGPPPPVVDLARWAAWRWAVPLATLLRAASPERNVLALPVLPPRRAPVGMATGTAGAGQGPHAAEEPGLGRPGGLSTSTAGAGQGPHAAAAVGPVQLRRVPPATDLLPLVLEAVATAGVGQGPHASEEPAVGGGHGGAPGGPNTSARGPGSVVVLVPSVGWAERLAERLRRRGVEVARDWAEAAAGWPVVVGSRTAAWAPVPRLAGAVVLDAHDEAYRDRYDATLVLAERAAREGAPCLLVSPCPTAVQVHRYGVVAAPRPVERAGWPAVSVVDRRGADPRTGLLSEELARLAARPLVCVLNRTGRARLLACATCGELARCERCGRPVERGEPAAAAGPGGRDEAAGGAGSLGEAGPVASAGVAEPRERATPPRPARELLRCGGCGVERPVVCAGCGATRLKVLRQGVSQVRDELAALLGEPVAEVSGPRQPVPAAPVLVGTEAVLHRVRRAAAVVFLDFDQHLLAPRFAAAEESLALVARAARLVRDGGVVLVQTRLPDHEVLAAAVGADPSRLDEHELALRRELSLPPFAALATASGEAAAPYLEPLGGVPLGDGRWLLRAPDHARLCDALAATPRPPGALRVTVDPTDL